MELLDKIKHESELNIRMLELEMMKEIWFDMKSIELTMYDDDIDINYKYRGINGVELTKLLNNLVAVIK